MTYTKWYIQSFQFFENTILRTPVTPEELCDAKFLKVFMYICCQSPPPLVKIGLN